MTDTSAMHVLEIMRQRFTSGNSIPVDSARIKADEWDTIRAIIEQHEAARKKWEAEEKALRVFILRNAAHGVDDTGEYCRADEFTRTVFEDGTAEVYPCTCGLDELRAILNREQEKQP